MPLTTLALKNAKNGGAKRLRLSDGGGLCIEISPNGAKTWKLNYRFAGKQKTLSGGRYPDVSLADARGWREDVKRKLRAGEDPAAEARQEKRSERRTSGVTFETVAWEWFGKQEHAWSKRYTEIVRARLEKDAIPVIGDVLVADISHEDVLGVIRRFEDRDALVLGSRVVNYVSKIIRFAIANGLRKVADPTPDVRDAMKKRPKVRNQAKLPVARLPEFYERLEREKADPVTKLALRWTILTMVRTVETRMMRPEEIEGLGSDEPLWRIPPERMKMGREHIVPLSRQAADIFRQADVLRKAQGSPWVFPQAANIEKPISENCMLYRLYDLGYKGVATVHGFRGVASTVLNEQTDSEGRRLFDADWIELQLAHVEEKAVRGAYNAAEYLKPRRRMVQWWADFLSDQGALAHLL